MKNKALLLLLSLFTCAGSINANSIVKSAIKERCPNKLRVAMNARNFATLFSAKDKEEYLQQAHEEVEKAKTDLAKRKSFGDIFRMGIGSASIVAGSVAGVAVPTSLIFGLMFHHDGEDSEAMMCGGVSAACALISPFLAWFGINQYSKGKNKLGRRNKLDNALAVENMLQQVAPAA